MYRLGYTQGVFDMFHIGHLSIINRAAAMCRSLIVGVNSDCLVREYKGKSPVIRENERAEIVRNLRAVERCEIVETLDKVVLFKRFHFDAVFIGDDWKGSERWVKTEEALSRYHVPVIYLPHTPEVSSTMLRTEAKNAVE